MPTLSFNHFNLRAEQPLLDRLRDFYVGLLGLEVGWRPPFGIPGYWLYLGDQAVLHLVQAPPMGPAGAEPAGTLDHVAFRCSGLPEFAARLDSLGVQYWRTSVPGTTMVQLFTKDPAGNGVELNFASADD